MRASAYHTEAKNGRPDAVKTPTARSAAHPSLAQAPLRRVASVFFAVVFLVASAPLFLLAAILVKAGDRGSFFYRSQRLGYGKRPFPMLKLRTLVEGAEQRVHGDIVSPTLCKRFHLEHRFGQFLRETRLDELPQLFNIIRGEMNFIGPRPIRPEVYAEHARGIPDFDVRFEVRPGLFGPSQVYTPHSAPKRIRAILDNRFVRRDCGPLEDMLFVSRILLRLLWRLGMAVSAGARRWWRRRVLLRGIGDRRICERVPQRKARILYCKDNWERRGDRFCSGRLGVDLWEGEALLEDISDGGMRIRTHLPVSDSALLIRLEKTTWIRGGRSRLRIAYCRGKVIQRVRQGETGPCYHYLLRVEPASPLNGYRIEKYFLNWSIA